jgi:hypothetical protein
MLPPKIKASMSMSILVFMKSSMEERYKPRSMNLNVYAKTLENTIQFTRAQNRYPMCKHYRTRFLAANVNQLNETVATDIFFADVPPHDDGIRGHGGASMVQFILE